MTELCYNILFPMQSDEKNLYKLTSERTGKPIDLYKDVGSSVFSYLYSLIKKPPSIIIKLKGVGTWYLRRKRMQIVKNYYPENYDELPIDTNVESPLSIVKLENKKELFKILKERLIEYEKYLEERSEVKKERFKTQKPIEYDDSIP